MSLRARILELERAARALDPGAAEREALMGAAHGFAQDYLDALPHTPAYNHDKTAARALREHAPRSRPRPVDELIQRFDECVVRPGLLPSHPGTWPTSPAAASSRRRSPTTLPRSRTNTPAFASRAPGRSKWRI